MMEQFMIVLRQVLTLFLVIGVGFFLGKKKLIRDSSIGDLTFLMFYIALPCSIIKSFLAEQPEGFWGSIGLIALLIVGMDVLLMLGSLLLFRREDDAKRPIYQLGSIYSNSAFMGLALVQAVLGESAVIFATVAFIIDLVFFMVQAEISMPMGKPSVRKVLTNPGVVGFFIGMLLMVTKLPLPQPVTSSISMMGAMNSPLAMLLVGLSIAKADLRSVFNQWTLYKVSFLKLIAEPAIAAVLLLPFPVSRAALCTTVICKAACQPAVLTAYAAERGRDAVAASQLVALSSILQLVTLPLAVALVRMI